MKRKGKSVRGRTTGLGPPVSIFVEQFTRALYSRRPHHLNTCHRLGFASEELARINQYLVYGTNGNVSYHYNTSKFLSKFKFSIDPRGDLARKTMCFICLGGKISKQTEKAAFSSNQMFNVNDSLMNGTKRVRINSFFLRIKQEYFQPKNGTITRIFSLGRKKNFLIYKKQCITRIFGSGF